MAKRDVSGVNRNCSVDMGTGNVEGPVRAEVARLLEMGRDGGYIFAPAHDVEGDVPLENILAAIEVVQAQTA